MNRHLTPPSRLLAKSSNTLTSPRAEETLRGHTAAVIAAAEALIESTGRNQLTMLGLDPERWLDRFQNVVLLACWLHDLGKANDQFQDMVRNLRKGKPQAIRHETLSYLIVRQHLQAWLNPRFNDEDLTLALWAGAGHHRKFPPGSPAQGSGDCVTLWLDHKDFFSTLELAQAKLNLSAPPKLQLQHIEPSQETDVWLLKQQIKEQDAWDVMSMELRRFLAGVKACVIASDVGGSALPKHGAKLKPWIQSAFQKAPSPEDIKSIVTTKLAGHELRDFQKLIARSKSRVTLALAGCGSGKTVAAYHWAEQRAPGQRLYFCYPTTGTTTEGYRDYLHDPEVDARLVHSRASVDLEIFDLYEDDSPIKPPVQALESWSTPIICSTVDSVLGLVQNQRGPLFSWPSIASSAFIFDEIHAYDNRLYGALLRFLECCRGARCLLMTASLPRPRLDALKTTLQQNGEELTEVKGPKAREEHPRYRRAEGQLSEILRSALARGDKILWVSNTVSRVIRHATELHEEEIEPILYHSRFRYLDRVKRHKAVIDAFKTPDHTPALALASQVCEMSLDISADLLITDLAPVPALIQRLGRLNRRAKPGDASKPALFLVINSEPKFPEPYTESGLALARQWLEQLGSGALSQTDLARAWEELGDKEAASSVESAWIDGGFQTIPLHLRTISPGITVLLPKDAVAIRKRQGNPAKLRIPMTVPRHWKDWQSWYQRDLYAHVPPPSAVDYDPLRGAQWRV